MQSTRSGVSRLVSALVACVCVLALPSCRRGGGGDEPEGGFSDTIEDYIPEEVDGKPVDTDSPDAVDFAAAFEAEGVVRVVAGSVAPEVGADGTRQFPELLMLVAEIESGKGPEIYDDLDSDRLDVDSTTIGGVEVRFLQTQGQDPDMQFTIGIAMPRDDVGIQVASYNGGRPAAEAAIEAMIEAGRE